MTGVDPYLTARLGYPKAAGGLELRFDCPSDFCVKRRQEKGADQKLYVNFSKGVFHCLRCSWGGSVDMLYHSLGLERGAGRSITPIDIRQAVKFLDDDESSSSDQTASSTHQDLQSFGIYLPPTTTHWDWSDALEWLKRRLATVPPEEVKDLMDRGVILRGSGKFWDRVFFLDRYQGSVRYWTARTYLSDVKPKYLNPFNVPRRNVMFNQEVVESRRYDTVIITEGSISAIVAGPDTVGTYGRCVTDVQIGILLSLPATRFIIAAESDENAKKDALVLAEALTRNFRESLILDLPPGEDPASMGRPAFREYLSRAVPFTWKEKLIRRLSCP